MKTTNSYTGPGSLFSPPGWPLYGLGFIAGLLAAVPQLMAGQTDEAAASGVAAFFSLTVGVWLSSELTLMLIKAFNRYQKRIKNRLDKGIVPPTIGMDRPTTAGSSRWKWVALHPYMVAIPLYTFPIALAGGATSALTKLSYSIGGLDPGTWPIPIAAFGAIAACCLTSIGIWCIVQEIRLKNLARLADLPSGNYARRQNPVDLATIRVSRFLGYLTARRV